MFKFEKYLTQAFDAALLNMHSPFKPECIAREFDYREGRTDFIASDEDGNVIAFELKLERWKEALYQAYRNSSFAHYSYVVVPVHTARRAIKQKHEFQRRGIGLCSIEGENISIEIEAQWASPLRPWLTEFALEYLDRGADA